MRTLFLIPARGGSKGIPKKNIKELAGKPLIHYTIDVVRSLAADVDICVSTDCLEIISVVEEYGLKVPFIRPASLSSDSAGTYEVLLHALDYYKNVGRNYDNLMLLQPTSPFRKVQHLNDVLKAYKTSLDMIVSVNKSHHNPYFSLFEEDASGFLHHSKDGYYETRQAAPNVYAYNGAIYLINTESLRSSPLNKFQKVKKYVMDDIYSVDIDSALDWAICETIIREGYIKNENS